MPGPESPHRCPDLEVMIDWDYVEARERRPTLNGGIGSGRVA